MVRLYELELERECIYGKNPEDDYRVLIETCKKFIPDFNEVLIKKAFDFVCDEFKHITRISGDPYYTHLLKVALILMTEIGYADNNSVVAALLHDMIEDIPHITHEFIEDNYNTEVADLVEALTKIKGVHTRELDKAATYTKLFESLIKDVRVILIKLADRLDNLRTLHYMEASKRKVIAEETLNFYTPFAQRLGLIKIKILLEDLSLYFIDTTIYEMIKKALEDKRIVFLSFLNDFYDQITESLNQRQIEHKLTIEHKHVYEIYKMIEQGKTLSEIDNFYSMVISLGSNDYSDCYKAYGIIANLFGPVRTFNDYIALPKINFYRAIHSTHFGPGRKLAEVIIRTDEMDKLIEGGISALFSIRDSSRNLNINTSELESWTEWMQSIVTEGEDDAMSKIWGTIRMNLYHDYITVYTQDRKSYNLPAGSCPIDLAFMISDLKGFQCISSKVNGVIKSLRYELCDNDVIEIISSPNSKPDFEWTSFVVTHNAVAKLYKYFHDNPVSRFKTSRKKLSDSKFRIIGEDKPGMLNEITKAIGQVNIHRINLVKTSDSVFEGVFTINLQDETSINSLFSKLLNIKGLRGVERIEDFEQD